MEKKVDMMRILFCNIAWMKEYRGNEDGKDTPLNGGSYVDETGDAYEKYNFTPVNMEGKLCVPVGQPGLTSLHKTR